MIDSIFVALSGMLGYQRGLNVISNNVTNLNTPAFRGSKVNFADVFSGTTANGGQPNSSRHGSGSGVDTSRTILDNTPGIQQHTGVDLDLALNGEGFFVLQSESGEISYTRNGRFDFKDGELVAADLKSKVMARNASGSLVPIELKGLERSPPKATTEVTFDQDLSSDGTEHSIDSLTVFDKQGGKHTLSVKFTKNSDTNPNPGAPPSPPGSWNVSVLDGSQEIGSGTLEVNGFSIDNSQLRLTLALTGADPIDVDFNFDAVHVVPLGANTPSSLAVQKQDGFGPGTITARTFDEKGVLKLTYSNGQKADGPKLVLAEISDEDALTPAGTSRFTVPPTENVTLREAGDDLKVASQSLELSNVDLTSQFSELILMQRGYQASSQVLSTANDMLQELLQIKGNK